MHSFMELKMISPIGSWDSHARNHRYAATLADKAVQSLLEEVRLTPKPGLVDALNSGSHLDMNIALFEKSAHSLWSTFYDIAVAGCSISVSQHLREEIARIGRQGEATMYEVTEGINTHKGAIWSLGLITAVAATKQNNQMNTLSFETILSGVAQLAKFPDCNYQPPAYATHGKVVQEKYHVKNALQLAKEGFPVIRNFVARYYSANQILDRNIFLGNLLLGIISQLDDTCILYRSNDKVLLTVKTLAQQILLQGGMYTKKGKILYLELEELMHNHKISPGGSADMLAASIFIEKILKN